MSNSQLQLDPQTLTFALRGARPHYSPDRPGQVEHIALDLRLDLWERRCDGTCNLRLNPIRDGIEQLTLDAVGQQIHRVSIADQPQPFTYDGEQLRIHLQTPTRQDQRLQLKIDYSLLNPQRGLYFVAPDVDYPDKPWQAWTQGEDEDSRFWFPCFDYPGQLASSEIRVRVPEQYLAISNGNLVATGVNNGEKIYHWVQQQVHPSYLITLAVGEFAELQDQWQGKPVTYYVPPERATDAHLSLGKTPQMLEFFSQRFGYAYPYPKYAQVCVADFIFGGMENTSTTLLGDRYLLDSRAALDNRHTENLVAHELAHQWFGDLLVIKHWSHAWLKEGMASYAEVLWTEETLGADEAAYYRLGQARAYISEDSSRYRRPIVTHVYREAIELYDHHLYEKGACVYHMLRANLGETLFWSAIHRFVSQHAHQTIETVDLLRAIEQATGRNLLPLFDQYVYRGGHPDYKVAYSWDANSQLAKLTVTQTQAVSDQANALDQGLFDLQIPIGFGTLVTAEGATTAQLQTFSVRVYEREQSFYFPLTNKPSFISFDLGNHHLKTVELEYPLPELQSQLAHDPDPLSRIFAASALAKKGNAAALQSLAQALQTDPFWAVRAEVSKQIAKVPLESALSTLAAGLQDPDPRVRRAVVEAIAELKTAAAYKLLKPLVKQGDPSYYVEAAALAGIGTIAGGKVDEKPEVEKVLAHLSRALEERSGWNEVVRIGAINGLSHLKNSAAALDLILTYTRRGIAQPLRLAAIRVLGKVASAQSESAQQERILQALTQLAGESFFLTQVAVVVALGQWPTLAAVPVLQTLAQQSMDGRVKRMADEAIAKLQRNNGSDAHLQALQTELDQLKQANRELNSRLSALEALQSQDTLQSQDIKESKLSAY